MWSKKHSKMEAVKRAVLHPDSLEVSPEGSGLFTLSKKALQTASATTTCEETAVERLAILLAGDLVEVTSVFTKIEGMKS